MNRRVLAPTATLVLLGLAALLPSGCLQGAELQNKEELQKERDCDTNALLERSCGGTSCHEASSYYPIPPGGVIFFGPEFPNDLIDLGATYPSSYGVSDGTCPVTDPQLIIDSNDPMQSYLLKRVRNEKTCMEGPMPPPPKRQLGAREVECLEQWVVDVVAGKYAAGAEGATP